MHTRTRAGHPAAYLSALFRAVLIAAGTPAPGAALIDAAAAPAFAGARPAVPPFGNRAAGRYFTLRSFRTAGGQCDLSVHRTAERVTAPGGNRVPSLDCSGSPLHRRRAAFGRPAARHVLRGPVAGHAGRVGLVAVPAVSGGA